MPDEAIRLNIGAGDHAIPGFISIDQRFGHKADQLDYADNSVDEVYASHVLEHFAIGDVQRVLREWVRVLKPGGRIRVAVPSVERALLLNKKFVSSWELTNRWICGGQTDAYDFHLCSFTDESLERLMQSVGLRDVSRCAIEYEDCSSIPVSIIRSGTKSAFVRKCDRKRRGSIVGVAMEPRLNFSMLADCMNNTCEAFRTSAGPLPVAKDSQVYWSKSMENKIAEMIDQFDPDYIVTFDFDSGYSPEDLNRLLTLMDNNLHLGAIFPVQMHRHADHPLCFRPDQYDYSTEITQVHFGHFGLTVIRREVFDVLKKQRPWFFTMPSPHTATYDDYRESDGDISFWRLLIANGIPVAQANRVVIGHGELCMMWPGKGETRYQKVADFTASGRPADVVFDALSWVKPAPPPVPETAPESEAPAPESEPVTV